MTSDWNNVHIPSRKLTAEYHRRIAELVTRHTGRGGSVIDIGAGLGNILNLVHAASPELELHAADTSGQCLEVIRRAVPARTHALTDNPGSIAALGEGRFDTAVMSHVLEHTTQPLATLHSAMRVVKPDGHLIIAVPNPTTPRWLAYSAAQVNYVNQGHVCCWDRSHWINFLENIAQLNVVSHQQDEVRVFPQRLSFRLRPLKEIENLLAMVFPWWAHSHISIVQRAA